MRKQQFFLWISPNPGIHVWFFSHYLPLIIHNTMAHQGTSCCVVFLKSSRLSQVSPLPIPWPQGNGVHNIRVEIEGFHMWLMFYNISCSLEALHHSLTLKLKGQTLSVRNQALWWPDDVRLLIYKPSQLECGATHRVWSKTLKCRIFYLKYEEYFGPVHSVQPLTFNQPILVFFATSQNHLLMQKKISWWRCSCLSATTKASARCPPQG